MAGEPSIQVTTPFPRIDYNPAVAGRYEERPSLIPALTQAYQIGTNLVENAWVNNYKYNLAQLNLQSAQSRLDYQDQYNQVLKQQYDQQQQLFPLQLKQQQQVSDQNQIALDQQNYNLGQDKEAQNQLQPALAAINDLQKNHVDDLNFDDQINDIRSKYTTGFSRPATAGALNAALANLYAARNASVKAQTQNSAMAALEHAQNVDHLIPDGIDVRQVSMQPGGIGNLTRMANQSVLTQRAQTILQNSRPGTDSYNWATEMLGVLGNQDQTRANQMFDAHGMLNEGVAQSLGRWEQTLNLTPKTAGVVGDVDEEYGPSGKLVKRTVKIKNQNLQPATGQGTSNEKSPLPQTGAEMVKDPVWQRLATQIPPELRGDNATDAQRKAWMYGAYAQAKGLNQAGQQNQPSAAAQPAQGFLNPAQPAPTPAPTPRGRGRPPGAPAPGQTQAPNFSYPIPRVQAARPPAPPRVIAPAGERRRRPPLPAVQGFQEGGLVQAATGQQGIDQVPANLTEGEYIINQEAADAIGTENLDALNQIAEGPRQAPPSISVEQGDPFTMAFIRARRATEVPDELLQPQAEWGQVLPQLGALRTQPTFTQPQPTFTPQGAGRVSGFTETDHPAGSGVASVRTNNPGAMWPGPSAKKFGSTSYSRLADGNLIAHFDNPVNGAAAQFDLLDSGKYMNRPIGSLIDEWSGHTGGAANVSQYANSVAKSVGLNASDRLTPELLRSSQGIQFAKAMARMEAGGNYPLSDAQWQQAQEMALGSTAEYAAR